MKFIAKILLFGLALSLSGLVFAGKYNSIISIGDPMPTFSKLPSISGKNISSKDLDEDVLQAEIDRAMHPLSKPATPVHELRGDLQNAMWDHVGVMRTEKGLQRGLKELQSIDEALMQSGIDGTNLAFNLTWHDWLNMRSLIDISQVITLAGLERENSRGAHHREDFPDEGDLESSTFTVARKQGDSVGMTQQAVEFTMVRPGETILDPAEPETLVATQ